MIRIKFYPEKRKDKTSGEVKSFNVPIQMHIFFDGKRCPFFTGCRCDLSQWDEENQCLRRNQVNASGQTSALINKTLTGLSAKATLWANENPKGSIDDLLTVLRQFMGKKEHHKYKESVASFCNVFERYVNDAHYSMARKKRMVATLHKLTEYEPNVTFDTLSAQFLTDYRNHLIRKGGLSKNTANGELRRLKAFCNASTVRPYFKVPPFAGITIEAEVYGDPIYLTKQERDLLFDATFSNARLEKTRDLFVLQCYIGCRVGDYLKLKKENLKDGNFIEYIAGKTKDDKPNVLRVPLTDKPLSIIRKYGFPDGKLMPFITDQRYNDYLKEVFEFVGLTRSVTILDKNTTQTKVVPLNTIAASHMARKTFIGILYKRTKDSVICSMSGHTIGSKALARYYTVDDEDKLNALTDTE